MNAMNTQDLSETITVTARPEAVFAAINNVRGWWSGIIEGESAAVGNSFSYRYKDMHRSTQEVIEQVPGRRVAWKGNWCSQCSNGGLGYDDNYFNCYRFASRRYWTNFSC